jgi:transposase
VTDAKGTPLVARVTAANVNDSKQLIPMVDAIPCVKGKVGAPRRRPDAVQGDRGYRSALNRGLLWVRGIEPIIPPDRVDGKEVHGSGLGTTRWVVERTISWLRKQRRLRVRYERRADIHQAFLTLGCALICHRTLQNALC